ADDVEATAFAGRPPAVEPDAVTQRTNPRQPVAGVDMMGQWFNQHGNIRDNGQAQAQSRFGENGKGGYGSRTSRFAPPAGSGLPAEGETVRQSPARPTPTRGRHGVARQPALKRKAVASLRRKQRGCAA